ncbi:hypothetical protein C8Q80DRAFT_1165386 [Daedaleopsis nitida]|nr:hypothetical protein C8Q80DRAFT_1165386 [Daedaleopsis nitida]
MLKAVVLFMCGLLFGASIKPPHPAVKEALIFYRGQPLENIIRGLAYFGVIVLTAAFSYFAITIIALSSLPQLQDIVPYVCPTGTTFASSLMAYSPRFFAGVFLLASGAILRLWSFRAMGTLFTFEVVITHEHRLVKSGPYALARHPSYTGVIFILLGVHLIQFGPGGFVSECDIASTVAGYLIYVWCACLVFVPASLWRRCVVEDEQLHNHFGDAWLQYKDEVSCRFLPLVY